jgi:hypothetical protein
MTYQRFQFFPVGSPDLERHLKSAEVTRCSECELMLNDEGDVAINGILFCFGCAEKYVGPIKNRNKLLTFSSCHDCGKLAQDCCVIDNKALCHDCCNWYVGDLHENEHLIG